MYIGFIKDLLAVFLFLITIILIYKIQDLNKYKNYILLGLLLCLIIDLIFSSNYKFHCMKIGYNIPTITIFITILLFIFILVISIYNHFTPLIF